MTNGGYSGKPGKGNRGVRPTTALGVVPPNTVAARAAKVVVDGPAGWESVKGIGAIVTWVRGYGATPLGQDGIDDGGMLRFEYLPGNLRRVV